MTDHYEEFRPEEIDERVEQLLQLDDVEFPSSDLEHDVRLAKHLELLFRESGNADRASLQRVEDRLFQQLQQNNYQSENSKIIAITRNNTRYLKKDQRIMQKNTYHRSNRMIEVLVAVFFLAIVGSGLLVFLHIYQQSHQSTAPAITPTAVPAHPKETRQAVKPGSTPTAPERSCNNSAATQQTSPGTYVRKYDRIFKLDNQSGQIDWTFILPGEVKSSFSIDPLVVGNTVYVSSYSGSVFALDADRGTALWSQQYPVYVYSPKQSRDDMHGGYNAGSYSSIKSLQVDCGLLAFIGSDENLHVLDATTGVDVWHTNMPKVSSSPTQSLVGGHGTLYLSSSIDGNVHAYNIINGHALWNQPLVANNTFMHIANNMLYSYSQVLDTTDGHVLLDIAQIQSGLRIQRIEDSIAYFYTPSRTLVGAYDINAHNILWEKPANGVALESHGRVFIQQYFNSGNTVVVLDGKSGQMLWEKNLNWWQPDNLADQALDVGNVLYLRDTNNVYGTSLDGQTLWSYSYPLIGNYTPGISSYNISYGDQWMYRFTQDQYGFHLTAINPQIGQVAWKQDLSYSTGNSLGNADPRYPSPSPQAPFNSGEFGIVTIVS